MLVKTQGIVIKSIKYAESSIICHIFTEKLGRHSYIINSVRSAKSKTKSSLFQPLTILDLVVYKRENKNIDRVSEVKSALVYEQIPFDVVKSSIALFISELMYKTIHEHEVNESLFNFLREHLIFLDKMNSKNTSNYPIYFTLHLTKFLGFSPNENFNLTYTVFDLDEGKFVDEHEKGNNFLNKEYSGMLFSFLKMNVQNAMEIKISKYQRSYLLDALMKYYQIHIEKFQTLKSIEVLEQVFS